MEQLGDKLFKYIMFFWFFCFVVLVIYAIDYIHVTEEERIERLERWFGTDFPEDATDLVYDYNLQRGFFVNVSFSAPPDQMDEFSQVLCDGKLYQGYDPFDATNTYRPMRSDSVLVHTSSSMYHSYSPNAPDTMWGNRCLQGGFTFAAIDKSDPLAHHLVFIVNHSPYQETEYGDFNPSDPPNYINPLPQFPFMIISVIKDDDQHYAISSKICFAPNVSYTYPGIFPNHIHLLMANLEIVIDDTPFISGRILRNFAIELEDGTRIQQYEACIEEDWGDEPHTIDIVFTNQDTDEVLHHFTITFSAYP